MHDTNSQEVWWKECVFYQIYPSSFADSNADGIGDLVGITKRLDYLTWLGINAFWLSPFYDSPMKDGGYDVQDYTSINPVFGNFSDFDNLVQAAHLKNIKIIIDWVPNHTSDQHEWFKDSKSSKHSPKRDWYIWRDQPNNLQADLGSGSAWTYDEQSDQYYFHSYLPEQPDLNWDNPELRAAMIGTLAFWLDRGVDGFRADVINMIAEDYRPVNVVTSEIRLSRAHTQNMPQIHGYLKDIRACLDAYPQKPIIVGELWLDDVRSAAEYYGDNDELHLLFNFKLALASWTEVECRQALQQTARGAVTTGRWPSTVFGNHDMPRIAGRTGSPAQARAAAVMLTTLPGSLFIFAGDEFGLEDAVIAHQVDPGGREKSRAPLPWSSSQGHGWPHAHALPFPANANEANYESLYVDPLSILHLYKNLLALRKNHASLRSNSFKLIDSPRGTIAYERQDICVVVNFTPQRVAFELTHTFTVLMSSDSSNKDVLYNQLILPYEAVVIKKS